MDDPCVTRRACTYLSSRSRNEAKNAALTFAEPGFEFVYRESVSTFPGRSGLNVSYDVADVRMLGGWR